MFGFDAPSGVEIMLLHRWPSSVYVDPYQLESLRGQSDWQVRVLPFFLFFLLKQQQQLRILFMLCINYESSRYSLKGLTGFSYWSGAACAQGLRVCYLCVSQHWKTNFRTCKSNNSDSWSLQWAFIWWENNDISGHRCPRAAAVEWKLWVKTKLCLLSNFIKLKMSCSDLFN